MITTEHDQAHYDQLIQINKDIPNEDLMYRYRAQSKDNLLDDSASNIDALTISSLDFTQLEYSMKSRKKRTPSINK